MHAGATFPYFSCAITCQKVLRRQLVLRFQTSMNSFEPQSVTPRVGVAFACIVCIRVPTCVTTLVGDASPFMSCGYAPKALRPLLVLRFVHLV